MSSDLSFLPDNYKTDSSKSSPKDLKASER